MTFTRISLSLLLSLFPISRAATSVTTLAARVEQAVFSTFVYQVDHGNLTFSLNAAQTTGDVFFHFSAPEAYSWVSVGTGSEMDGSVMWVFYKSSDANNLTLSPRLSSGHVEPSFSKSINCVLVDTSISHNGIITTANTRYYSANVHCKNITSLGKDGGKLDLTKSRQPFLYAFGPTDSAISSKSQTAGIKRHEEYGTFWMDMTKATSGESDDAAVPSGAALLTTTNAAPDGGATQDGDKVGPAHAAITLAAFVIIFPLGAILLRYLDSVKIHGIVQGLGVLAALVGIGVGIYLSTMYNHSKNISSGHQIFGLILLALVFIQWAIGLYHHLRYRKHKRPTAWGKVHLFAGPLIVLGGIINGFTGFNFSGEPHNNVYYGIAVAIVVPIVIALLVWKRWSRNSRRTKIRSVGSEDGINLHNVPQSHDLR